MGNVTEAVNDGVGVRVSPDERSRVLHDGEEARQVVNLTIWVSAIHDTGKVKQMSALVELCPQSSLKVLFGILQCGRLAEQIQVSQDTKDVAGHTSSGQDVEKLHSLHLETVVAVNHEKNDIGNLGDIHHGFQLVGTLHERQSLFLRGNDGDGALGIGKSLLGISSDERF
jgi:hypothetical protein